MSFGRKRCCSTFEDAAVRGSLYYSIESGWRFSKFVPRLSYCPWCGSILVTPTDRARDSDE